MDYDYNFSNQFLNLPNIDNINHRPSVPYELKTDGMIHSSNLELICNYLLHNQELDWQDKIQGHVLSNKIGDLPPNKLSDFAIHLLSANRDKLSWDLIDSLIYKLSEKYTPRWDLPNFSFVEQFDFVFSKIVLLDIEKISKLLLQSPIKPENLEGEIKGVYEKIVEKRRRYNIKELIMLFDYLVEFSSMEEKHDETIQSLEVIFSTILKDQKQNEFTTEESVIFTLLYTRSNMKIGNSELLESKKMLEQALSNIKKLGDTKILTYRYLIGASYSLMAVQFYEKDFDFLDRRNLINNFISNFIELPAMGLGDWFNQLLEQESLDDVGLELIIQGYLSLLTILKVHIYELPYSEDKEKIIRHLQNLSVVLMKTSFSYLESIEDNIGTFKGFNANEQRHPQLKDKPIQLGIIGKFKELAINSLLTAIKSNANFNSKSEYIERGRDLLEEGNHNGYFQLYNLTIQLYQDTYNFDKNLSIIIEETEGTNTLMSSQHFEEEIMAKIKSIEEYIQSIPTSIDTPEYYYIIIHYLVEWINYFRKENKLYYETLMILSTIISMFQTKIVQYFYQNNKTNESYIEFINLHAFLNSTMEEMQEPWNIPKFKKEGKTILNKFKDTISDWDQLTTLRNTTVKSLVLEIEDNLGHQKIDDAQIDKMIDDDIIIGYLDKVEIFEKFLEVQSQLDEGSNVNLVDNIEIYQSPSKESIFPGERIGYIGSKLNSEEFKFPLFRNPYEIATAISMYDVEFDKEKTFLEKEFKKVLDKFMIEVEWDSNLADQ